MPPNPIVRSLQPRQPAPASAPSQSTVVVRDHTWLERWLGRGQLPRPNVAAAAASPVGPLRVGRLVIQADAGVLAQATMIEPGLYLVGEVPDYVGGVDGGGYPGADAASTLGIVGTIADTAVGIIGDLGDWIGTFLPKHQQNLLDQQERQRQIDLDIAERQARIQADLDAEQDKRDERADFRRQRDAIRLASMMVNGGALPSKITVGPSRQPLSPEVTIGPATRPFEEPSLLEAADASPAGLPGRGPRWTPPSAPRSCCASCAAGRGCEGA